MFSFPTYLRMCWNYQMQMNNIKKGEYYKDIIEIISDLNNIYNQGSRYDIPIVLIQDGFSKESNELLEKISKEDKMKNISNWIYESIILNITKDNALTTQVKIRIASNMLRVTLQDDVLYRYSADSLILNIKQLQNEILNALLPF